MTMQLEAIDSPNVNHCNACCDFLKIPPLIRGPGGKSYVNPDFDMVKTWRMPATPFGGSAGTIMPGGAGYGGSLQFAFTVQAEENSMGDFLIREIMAQFKPVAPAVGPVRNVFVEFESLQNDRLLTNAPVENTLAFGTAFLNCCLPCCVLVQASNTFRVTVTNLEAFAVEVFMVARGKRFLPYHDPSLRDRMLAYWNSIPTTPYWLTQDQTGSTDVVNGTPQTVTMTVPGGGDFEYKGMRCDVLDLGGGATPVTADDVLIEVSEGVGRQWSQAPLPLGRFVATPTLAVAGFPDGLYNAAQACSCEQDTQFFKRNSRLRVTLTNTLAGSTARVRLAMVGCMHYVGECPPGRSLDRARSLEPVVGPMLTQEGRTCPPYQAMAPMPGAGMVPVNAQSAPGWALPPQQALPAMPTPAQLQGLAAMQQQARLAAMRGRGGPGPGHTFRRI